MNVNLSQNTIQLIKDCAHAENGSIEDQIVAICVDLKQSAEIGQTLYSLYENSASEKKESDERNLKYGIITANALSELQNKVNETKAPILQIDFDDKLLRKKSEKFLLHLQDLMEQFANQVYSKMSLDEKKISKISNFFQATKGHINEMVSILSQLAETFSCSPQEIENHAKELLEDNNNCRQMLEIIIQNIDSQDTNFNSIDSLLGQLGFKNTNIQLRLSKLFESLNQINEISKTLNTSPKEIKNEISKLIKEASKPKATPIQIPPQPQPPTVDTTELEEEILKLKHENEILSDSRKQLLNEKNGLIERIAVLQDEISQRSRPVRLSFDRFDYLASISPKPIMNSNSSMSQEEFDEALRSKNDMIAQLNFQLQDVFKSLKETQESNSEEINSMKERISNLTIEKDKFENKCTTQQNEIRALKSKINSLPQSELIRSLSTFFGGCVNEEEILNKVYELKNENHFLSVKVSESEMNASNLKARHQFSEGDESLNIKRISELKAQLNQATDQLESLQEQVSSLQKDNNRLVGTNNSMHSQIQAFRDNEVSMKEEISSNQRKIRESARTFEQLQTEYTQLSNQLTELQEKCQLFENESEKLLTSVDKIAKKIASSSQSQPRKKSRPGQSNGFDDLLNMCQVLQTIFMQYSMSNFSNSEKLSRDLISSIDQIQKNGIKTQDEDALTNEVMKKIVQEKVFSFMERIAKSLENIVKKHIEPIIEKFDSTRMDILEKVDDQTKELQDYIENDYSGPYSTIKRSYDELQEKYEALTRNMGMYQEQFGQHHQSRFVNSTPPRNNSRGSRSSIQSPSERVLDRTIQQNYNQSRFFH